MVNAVIFDLDGTVIDNEGEWEQTFQKVLDNHKELTLLRQGFVGRGGWIHEPGLGLANNWRRILEGKSYDIDKLVNETFTVYRDIVNETGIILPREGMGALVEKIKEFGWVTALCTGSFWTVVEPELEQLKLYLAFDITTTGEEILMQKPDPEIYTLTAQKIGCEPEEAIVIEDAIAGIRAATEAGMRSIGLISAYAPEKMLRAAGATWTATDLDECMKIITDIKAHQKDFE